MNESTQTYNTYTYIGPCGAFAISPQIRMLYIAEVKHRMQVVASQCKRMPNTWHTPLCRQAVAYFVVCFFCMDMPQRMRMILLASIVEV